MDFVGRKAWGAPADSPAAYQASTRGVKVHYLGSAYTSRKHSLCDDVVRSIRSEHLANVAEGYVDIAYTALVCEHGSVFEGRGTHKRTGANGNATLNAKDYAVCALLGSSGMTVPTDAMLCGLVDAIEWLRRSGDAGTWVGGHRDGFATQCPGDQLYAWVEQGAKRPAGVKPPESTPGVYVVREHDTIAAIARRLNVSWQELAAVNGIAAPYTIYPRQELKVPGLVVIDVPPFPGAGAFVIGRRHPAVLDLDKCLIAGGWTKHHDGDGYQSGDLFTEWTRRNVADFQRATADLRSDPDGYPGPLTWTLLHTPTGGTPR